MTHCVSDKRRGCESGRCRRGNRSLKDAGGEETKDDLGESTQQYTATSQRKKKTGSRP